MNKLDDSIKKLFLSHLLILSIITPAIIVKAQNNTASTSEPTAPKSTSILEAIVRLFKSSENRLITRGIEVCPISPGNLGEIGQTSVPLVMRRFSGDLNSLTMASRIEVDLGEVGSEVEAVLF